MLGNIQGAAAYAAARFLNFNKKAKRHLFEEFQVALRFAYEIGTS